MCDKPIGYMNLNPFLFVTVADTINSEAVDV